MTSRKRPLLIAACIVLGIAAATFAIWPNWFLGSGGAVTVYCAHDAVFADSILKEFEQQTGIRVNVVYDAEATKSLGLINRLKAEKDDPHADVFWNNELLGTMDLARDGLLQPYKGTGYARIPPQYKDDDGRWTGFAARMRVWIVNNKQIEASQSIVRKRFANHPASAAIAKPLYGTTLTHYSILWQLWGGPRLKQWDADMRRRGLRELAGNAPVKEAVAEGACEIGWTDTDDCFEAIDDGKPVSMLPILIDERPDAGATGSAGRQFTIAIPNTVCILRGCRRQKQAERLVDYLLSGRTELALANSKSRQIPLGAVDINVLTPEVRKLAAFVGQGYDLRTLETARRECLEWLKSESP